MKRKILSALALFFVITAALADYPQEKFCTPYGYCQKCYYLSGNDGDSFRVRSPDFIECPPGVHPFWGPQ